jgi:phosphatidate phosphatase APP1
MRDRDTFLVALVERGGGLFAGRLDGVEVSFHAGGREIGRARTDKLGYAIATGRVPPGAREVEAQATLDRTTMRSQGDVYRWEEGRTILVCDIDGTVSETDVEALLFDRWDTNSRPLPGSPETLQQLAKQYNLLFLTGRPVAWHGKTYKWLDDHGFPAAPAVLAPDVREAVKVEQFKAHTISMLRKLYPNVLVGIGNAETDSQAYTANGLLVIMIGDGKKRRFRPEAIPMRSWNQVQQFFDANNDVLSDPERLRALLSEGGVLHHPRPPVPKGKR